MLLCCYVVYVVVVVGVLLFLGSVKQKLMMTCVITNWMDLTDFPFDHETITISGTLHCILLV